MSPETLLGMELGKGVLQRLLGRGTMGSVYLAYQAHSQHQVAVKVFVPASTLAQKEQEEFLQRLQQEIARGATLEHPHILAILDHGVHRNLAYAIMPYVEGESLQTRLERLGALPFALVQQYLEQLASALDYAHGRDLLHRDIKTNNILLDAQGNVLLADFGLAGLTTEKNFALARQPQPGMLNYIAPEYVLGKSIDQRADLYSLGVVLYQMVTGTLPFQDNSLSETAMKHLKAVPPPPGSLRKDLPQAAEQVIGRALAKKPADRYVRAQDLASAFRLALEAAHLLPTVEADKDQTDHALALLSDLASGGVTAKVPRVSVQRKSGLLHPKWQTIAPTAEIEQTEQLDLNATTVLPTSVPLTPAKITDNSAEQPAASRDELLLMTGNPGVQMSGQIAFTEKKPAGEQPAISALTGQKRTRLLSFSNSQPTVNDLPSARTQEIQLSAEKGQFRLENKPDDITEELRSTASQKPGTPRQNTTGLLQALSTFPGSGSSENTGTIKLTEPVKIVQLPVAGQPGRFVTGFLPILPPEQEAKTTARHPDKGLKMVILVLAFLVIAGGGGLFSWLIHNHSSQGGQKTAGSAVHSNLNASAPARATGTLVPNIILSDSLSQNIHDWPVGQQGNFLYAFNNGAYHITNNDKDRSAPVILPGKVLTGSFTYSLTINQIKGNDTSLNNQFGMILDATVEKTNGKEVDTFYAFEVLNKPGGEYQFWKYDNRQNSTAPWTPLWTKSFGNEFLQGNGPARVNTFKIIADGKMFTFLVNGQQVGTLKDSSFSGGKVGMLVNLDGAEVAFSNLLLTKP